MAGLRGKGTKKRMIAPLAKFIDWLAAVVLAVPGIRSNRSFAEQIIWRRVRETVQRLRVEEEKLDMTSLNLAMNQPVIPKENILLIEAVHDLFTPKEPIEELWQT